MGSNISPNLDEQALEKCAYNVQNSLGHSVTFQPEWLKLWDELSIYYPEPSYFEPCMMSIVQQWCSAFIEWLERVEDSEDSVLVKYRVDAGNNNKKLPVQVKTCETTAFARPTTHWLPETSQFIVYIPRSRPSSSQIILAGFTDDLATTMKFSSHYIVTTTAISATQENNSATAKDVDSISAGGNGAGAARAATLASEPLPDILTLDRPEVLLARPPYRMIVRQGSKTMIEVQGSHQGSLKLLKEYLKSKTKNRIDPITYFGQPAVVVTLLDSVFGTETHYDTLLVEACRGKEVNVLLILALIENVLGYEPAQHGAGSELGVREYIRRRGFT